MQLAAPEAFDLSTEPASIHEMYGTSAPAHDGGFAKNCLLARRMLERGVRFVQVWSGPGGAANNWDNHGNISTQLPEIARQVDRPIAALVKDLKARGMFEDTLVIWTTEFGRMPFTQSSTGRDSLAIARTSACARDGSSRSVASPRVRAASSTPTASR